MKITYLIPMSILGQQSTDNSTRGVTLHKRCSTLSSQSSGLCNLKNVKQLLLSIVMKIYKMYRISVEVVERFQMSDVGDVLVLSAKVTDCVNIRHYIILHPSV